MLIVGFPVYFYHWQAIQKENKKRAMSKVRNNWLLQLLDVVFCHFSMLQIGEKNFVNYICFKKYKFFPPSK